MVLLVLIVTNVACSKKVRIKTQWQASNIKIDGKSNDWNIPLRYFDSKSNLNYNITNNTEGIFFAFRINEMSNIHQFNENGITIEIDTIKSKIPAHVLQYPAGGRPPTQPYNDEQNIFSPNKNSSDKEHIEMNKILIPQSSILLKGFCNYKKEVELAMEEVEGIKAAHSFDMENKSLFCEIFIPYSSIDSNAKTIQSSNSELNIKLLFGSTKNSIPAPPSRNENIQRPQGQNEPPPGGRPDGTHGGPPKMNNINQTKETEIKLEVQLSKQPTK